MAPLVVEDIFIPVISKGYYPVAKGKELRMQIHDVIEQDGKRIPGEKILYELTATEPETIDVGSIPYDNNTSYNAFTLVFTKKNAEGKAERFVIDQPFYVVIDGLDKEGIDCGFEISELPYYYNDFDSAVGIWKKDGSPAFFSLYKDVALKVEDSATTDSFRVMGRGEMHLSILIETMRREGYEFQVSTPQVLFQQENGKTLEPMEQLVVDVPDFATGSVMEKMGTRKGSLVSMNPFNGRTKLEFIVPARGLFGYRNEFLTDTKGEGIMSSVFYGYEPYKGDIPKRATGSLVAFETGTAVTYGLYNAQERGTLFIGAGVDVYEGMIVGQSPKDEDIVVNVCKKKHMTNTRASGSDDALRLIPPKVMSLEQAIEFIAEDELIEVTPKNIRMRKRILDKSERMKAWSKNKGQ